VVWLLDVREFYTTPGFCLLFLKISRKSVDIDKWQEYRCSNDNKTGEMNTVWKFGKQFESTVRQLLSTERFLERYRQWQ